jgi:LPXTG-site transpeptidase (sortase) family protein
MNKKILNLKKGSICLLLLLHFFGVGAHSVFAQTAQESQSVLYVPLIGITSVPQPLALPKGAGNVTYNYAVKNFLQEVSLTDVHVTDDKCDLVQFVTGDDNNNTLLDHRETWRYSCTTKLSTTMESIATVTGTANGITSTHKAYATVVVGSNNPPPLVSIINVTKVAYPLSLPQAGGKITFTYKVNNPGVVALSDVRVTDDKCTAMSGKLGDTNGNDLLDVNEVWIYRCTAILTQTTTNTVRVTAFANGLKALGDATITVRVANTAVSPPPNLPDVGGSLGIKTDVSGDKNLKIIVKILSGALAVLIVIFVLLHKKRQVKMFKKLSVLSKFVSVAIVCAVGIGGLSYLLLLAQPQPDKALSSSADKLLGWKFPVARFPLTGSGQGLLAYSDIRDPGGIPQGLPFRLKIPIIGVDSAIEDALITADGRMDVPAGSKNVAWFALGPHPGQEGSAVIGGHFGIEDGIPFVFYDLDKLRVGDKVYIVDDKDETLSFVVRSIKLFDRDADATSVFTSEDGLVHLNLITCEGIWNQVNDTYPERRVIFTDAIPMSGALAPPAPAFHRSLNVGAKGADVELLQTTLISKGFLVLPSGVAKGYFGALTASALAKYQVSVGLPAVGVFGPMTRAKLIAELMDSPSIPNTGIDVSSTPPVEGEKIATLDSEKQSSDLSQKFIRSAKSFYQTSADGVITFSLLCAIVFMVFKIFKRLHTLN